LTSNSRTAARIPTKKLRALTKTLRTSLRLSVLGSRTHQTKTEKVTKRVDNLDKTVNIEGFRAALNRINNLEKA
jgi:hypothetical protein